MRDAAMTGYPTTTSGSDGRLELRWLPVTDENGRTRMEACWITVGGQHAVTAA